MLKVSFYLIENKPLRRAELACRLAQQILGKHRIWWFCQSETECQEFDELLWSFDTSSFVPHAIDQLEQPVCLSIKPPHVSFDLCINFSHTLLDPQQLPHDTLHIIEIVGQDEQDKQQSRERFKHYKRLGINPVIHRI